MAVSGVREKEKLRKDVEAMEAKEVEGRPPVVFQFQPDSYKVLEAPEQLKAWERLMQQVVGLKAELRATQGSGTESCSCGCSDDCDMC